MNHALLPTLLLSLLVLPSAQAQATPTPLTLPPVQVTSAPAGLSAVPTAPLTFQVARTVRVQPARLETRLGIGLSTANLTFTVMTDVTAQVTVSSDSPHLILPGGGTLRLLAYTAQGVTGVALKPHSGTLTFRNSRGEPLASVPYEVAPARTLTQGLKLNLSPSSGNASLSYAVSGVPQSTLDPRWNVNLGVDLDTRTGNLSTSVSVGVNW